MDLMRGSSSRRARASRCRRLREPPRTALRRRRRGARAKLFTLRRRWGWRFARRESGTVIALHLLANGHDGGARVPHLHRIDGDVDANRARDAMRFPLADVSVRRAPFNEAVGVVLVASAAATAITRDVARHFGMV